ncbi:AAA family ATPase [Comamonas odontotermitis]|uniref:AAA family ATPase n=1 Tax=Comamonas odontotermitis TaxID=379895 RepID=UPI001CC7DAA0|nr:AAA family ATPase [Comamonas odontotermitis]UBB16438.1 AAA family ATPase [Comamonas odontotermitis]
MTYQKSAFEAVDASVAQALAFRPPMREAVHHQNFDLPAEPTFPPLEDDAFGKSGHSPAHKLASRVILQRGTDLHPEPIRWLWQHWLALGKLHILAGAPGQGKTTLALAMAATVTMGGRWPDGTRVERGNILIWSGEDDPADTLLPRLLAAGADRDRCYFIQGAQSTDGKMQPFDPARDLDALRQAIAEIGGMRLLVVDPVVSAVTGDSHKNTEVRRALQPLVDLASECGCAVLGISHFSKGGQGSDPAQRVVGSVAFTAVARVVLVAAKVKSTETGEDARILARAKSNIGPDDGGFEYHLEQTEPLPGIEASRIAWGKAVDGTARDLLTDPEDDSSAEDSNDICEMLKACLTADCWTPADEAQRSVLKAGFSKKQIWTASKKLGVVRKKGENGARDGWYWRLPQDSGSTQDSKIPNFQDVESWNLGRESSASNPGVKADKEVF